MVHLIPGSKQRLDPRRKRTLSKLEGDSPASVHHEIEPSVLPGHRVPFAYPVGPAQMKLSTWINPNFRKKMHQENIRKIMLWSSMPSTSRHHWGTDIDINGFDTYFNGTNEKANKEYEWLQNNAHKFGFCQVYSEKKEGGRTTGYNEEKWHWSYMPIANQLLEDYKKLITYSDIKDFSASELAKELNIIEEYVLGISTTCK